MSAPTRQQEEALATIRFEFGVLSQVADGADLVATDRDGDRWRIKPSGEFWAIKSNGERVNNRSRWPLLRGEDSAGVKR